MGRDVLVACATVLAILLPSPGSAAPQVPPQYFGTPIQQPDSNISISTVYARSDQYVRANAVCISFLNYSPRVVVHTQIMFASVDAAGNLTGSPKSIDDFNIVKPGYLNGPDYRGTCTSYDGVIYKLGPTIPWKVLSVELPGLIAWVDAVDYQDGASWRTIAPMPTVKIASPTLTPEAQNADVFVGTSFGEPESQIQVTYVNAIGATSGSSDSRDEDVDDCLSFRNASSKTITHVQFLVAHFDAQSHVIGNFEPIDDRTRLAPGAADAEASRSDCRKDDQAILQHTDHGTALFAAENVIVNRTGLLPTLYKKRNVASLLAWVYAVDFSDGTSWRALHSSASP